jgi:Kef-type K+ transport system membrane component KefB
MRTDPPGRGRRCGADDSRRCMMDTGSDIWAQLLAVLHTSDVLTLGILLFAGFLMGKVAERARLPAITGYIIAGLLAGPSVLGVVSEEVGDSLAGITHVALGLIALTIGGEFSFARVKRTGTNIIVLTLFEALFAFAMVAGVMRALGVATPISLLLGSIAAATAPAATVVIIRELKARGEFIDYLYGVVAFDDAVCVVLFSMIFAYITPVLSGLSSGVGILGGLWHAVSEIVFSGLIGFAGGVIVHLLVRRRRRTSEVLLISISFLFLVSALSIVLHLSSLIANMAMGASLINLSSRNRRVFEILEPLTPPVFALFFVIAGTELSISVFATGFTVLLGTASLLSRFAGKWAGVYLASALTAAPRAVKKYLGFCLVPQAGVALGLALFVRTSPVALSMPPEAREYLSLTVNVVLLSVFISQLIGPAVSRYGIKKGIGL